MADDSGGSGPAELRTPNGQPDGAASRADAPPTSGHDDATQPKKTWSLEDDDDDDEADANAPGTGGQGMALDDEGPELPSVLRPRASTPPPAGPLDLGAQPKPAGAGAAPAGPGTAPATGVKRTGKWRSLFEDSEDRDYMQSLLAKDLELPAAKRAKPAPAPAPAAKPAEDDDEVDPLDAFMATVATEVKKINELDSRKAQQAKGGGGAAAGAGSAKAADGQRAPPGGISVEDTDDEEDADTKDSTNEDEEDILALASKKLKRKDIAPVDHSKISYEPFRKEFYIEPPEIAAMTEEEVQILRNDLDGIKIRGQNCPKPIRKWTQCGLNMRILDVIKRNGWATPTSIQAQAIPAIMSGRDVIGVAKTGSGKTLAFLLPMFRHIMDQRPLEADEGPIGLILTPTRELAVQIYNECRKFAKVLNLRVVCAYGGAAIKDQIADLKRGAEIVVCTPGRMIDLLTANNGRVTNLRRVTYLVLDEADRMFDMGFEPQVMKIIQNVRPDKQMVLFSATFPRSMEALARRALRRPLELQVGGRAVVPPTVHQHVEVRSEDEKFLRLLELLGQKFDPDKRALVFVDRQDAADMLFKQLLSKGYPCLSIHGGKDQHDRDQTLADFKNGVCSLLIATSVLARGLDVKNLNLVVNYDVPNHMEDYVHRCGRTGRAGTEGDAYTFITPEQDKFAGDIVKALEMSGQPVPEDLQALADGFKKKVEAGDARYRGSGFSGKGLDHIDMAHALMKQTQRLTYSAAGDDIVSDEEEEEEVTEDGELIGVRRKPLTFASIIRTSASVAAERAAAAAAAAAATAAAPAKEPQIIVVTSSPAMQATAQPAAPSPTAAAPAAAAAGAAGATEAAGSPALPAAAVAAAPAAVPGLSEDKAAALRAAQERAAALNAALRSKLGGAPEAAPGSPVAAINSRFNLPPAPAAQPAAAASEKPKAAEPATKPKREELAEFWAEIEINDFSQTARWRVTNKETISQLTEYTKAAITTRGLYYPPGKQPKEGERKLHLLIEGTSMAVVDKAVNEIKRLLTEATAAAMERGGDRALGGRYSVV